MSANIYEPRGKAREYSPLALNYYSGCSHGCEYCYVVPMFMRWNSNYNHEEVASQGKKSSKSIFAGIEKTCKKHANSEKQVLLNFTSDPYNSLEIKLGQERGLTYFALQKLLENKIPVSILTKAGTYIERDIELYKRFNGNIIVGQSLTFENAIDSGKWEKGASSPRSRLNALSTLKHHGIKTWASFEPVIVPEQSLNLLETVCKENLCNYVKIGKLNNYKGIDKTIEWGKFITNAVNICRKYNQEFYIKHDLRKFKPDELFLSENECNQDYLNLKNTFNKAGIQTTIF